MYSRTLFSTGRAWPTISLRLWSGFASQRHQLIVRVLPVGIRGLSATCPSKENPDGDDYRGPRCCSSPAAATTSCRPSSSSTTTRRTPSTPPRSPRTRCSPAGTTSPAGNPAGKPSPTSPSTGPSPPSRASLANQRRRPAASRRGSISPATRLPRAGHPGRPAHGARALGRHHDHFRTTGRSPA